MEVRFEASFERDLGRIRSEALRKRIVRRIEELEAATALAEVPGIRRLTSGDGRLHRIRIGDYRMVMELKGTTVTLVRFGHRRDIYRYTQ